VRLPLHSFSLINWLCAWVELVGELQLAEIVGVLHFLQCCKTCCLCNS
jgi:hypothetical protein